MVGVGNFVCAGRSKKGRWIFYLVSNPDIKLMCSPNGYEFKLNEIYPVQFSLSNAFVDRRGRIVFLSSEYKVQDKK